MDVPHEGRCRELVTTRSLGLCEMRIPHVCQARATSQHHRFKPGRVWLPSNVLNACGDGTRGCHGWVEANPREARERGLWLMAGEDSLSTAALIAFRGMVEWYYLTNEGGVTWPGYDPNQVPPLVS